MIHQLILLIPLIFGSPIVQVDWVSKTPPALKLALQGLDPVAEDCAKEGLELRYRFYLRVCHGHGLWLLDQCKMTRRETHVLQYDPISEQYAVTKDLLDDSEPPSVERSSSVVDAFAAMGSVSGIDAKMLSAEEPEFFGRKGNYLGVRVSSECRGDYSRALSQLSSVLTLGLLRFNGFETGWQSFTLTPEVQDNN